MPRSSQPGRSTTSRAFAVLEAFHASDPTMTLAEIADRADLPRATTYRILKELVASGGVERTADGRYQIGLRLWHLGCRAPQPMGLGAVAYPFLARLLETTGETIQLCIPDRGGALVIVRVVGTKSVRDGSTFGEVLPLHATSVGKTILGYVADDRTAAVQGRRLRRFTPYTTTTWPELRREMDVVRSERVAYSRQEFALGTFAVAAPVFNAGGEFVAALGILTRSPAAFPQLTEAVRTASANISERL